MYGMWQLEWKLYKKFIKFLDVKLEQDASCKVTVFIFKDKNLEIYCTGQSYIL